MSNFTMSKAKLESQLNVIASDVILALHREGLLEHSDELVKFMNEHTSVLIENSGCVSRVKKWLFRRGSDGNDCIAKFAKLHRYDEDFEKGV